MVCQWEQQGVGALRVASFVATQRSLRTSVFEVTPIALNEGLPLSVDGSPIEGFQSWRLGLVVADVP